MPILARIHQCFARSLRYRLLGLVLFPILVALPAILGLAVYWSQQFIYDELYRKVNTDLSVAHHAFNQIQRDHLDQLKYLAESYAFRVALEQQSAARLAEQVQVLRDTTGFDFLHITDTQGRWLYGDRSGPQAASKPSPLQDMALQTNSARVGVEVYSHAQLLREDPALAQAATLPLVETPRAAPTDRTQENRAMVLRMIYPVQDLQGHVVALLDGGVLLNRNFAFVDAIRDLVYGPGSVPKDGWGVVTVFLDDVRISTNLPQRAAREERAIGTRASSVVRARVLIAGDKWISRSFGVSDWYISAYEPIRSVDGRPVGMLSTEYLEAPFRTAYHHALALLAGALVLTMVFAGVLAIRGAKSIFRPVESMTTVVRAEQAGERRRIGAVSSQDELGELARQFDHMLDLLDERNREIRRAATELEAKVESRTRELLDKNIRLQNTINLLQQTRQRLITAEKLAAVGELTAGIAHEINNPTAVILGNMDVVISELGAAVEPVATEVELIIAQVYRIRAIVDQLLQYSRPSQYVGYVEELDVNRLIRDTLPLVQHELERRRARLDQSLQAGTRIRINRQELQQVLVNLLVNAAHALPAGGRIELHTRDWPDKGVVIGVKDYGSGIPRERLGRVFDPFYTTKQGGGTGLGLSVSYGLVRRYGGQITVDSEEGQWTHFEVYLRRVPVFVDEDELPEDSDFRSEAG